MTAGATVAGVEKDRAQRLKRLAARAAEVTAERDQAIFDAWATGSSLRDIEAVTGIPFTSVREIIKRRSPATDNVTRLEDGQYRHRLGGELAPGHYLTLTRRKARVDLVRIENRETEPLSLDGPDHEYVLPDVLDLIVRPLG